MALIKRAPTDLADGTPLADLERGHALVERDRLPRHDGREAGVDQLLADARELLDVADEKRRRRLQIAAVGAHLRGSHDASRDAEPRRYSPEKTSTASVFR